MTPMFTASRLSHSMDFDNTDNCGSKEDLEHHISEVFLRGGRNNGLSTEARRVQRNHAQRNVGSAGAYPHCGAE